MAAKVTKHNLIYLEVYNTNSLLDVVANVDRQTNIINT